MSAPTPESNNPCIGIVIPAYKCEKFLPATLQSIAGQTYSRWECVVVDDGSPDKTAAAAELFASLDSRFSVLRQDNAGVAVARNRGIASLSSEVEFVTCMDSDDIYLPHALAVLSKELADNPTAVAAHAIADFIDENGDPMQPGLFAEIGRNRLTCSNGRPARVPLDEPSTFANVVTGSTMFPPGLLLTRRSVVDQVGGYDHTITPADDWDYFIRLCRLGPVAFVNEVLIQYRRHPNNQGAQSKVPEMCRRVYHKAFFSELNTPEQQEVLRQSWHAKQHLILESRLQAAQAHLRKGELLKAIVSLSKVPFIFYRYLRGYPTLGWL